MEKVLQELFWAHFFMRPYRSNGTKIHLDATLVYKQVLKQQTGNQRKISLLWVRFEKTLLQFHRKFSQKIL